MRNNTRRHGMHHERATNQCSVIHECSALLCTVLHCPAALSRTALHCPALARPSDQHLESSTKRTLVENETMVAELAYHTTQVCGGGGRTCTQPGSGAVACVEGVLLQHMHKHMQTSCSPRKHADKLCSTG